MKRHKQIALGSAALLLTGGAAIVSNGIGPAAGVSRHQPWPSSSSHSSAKVVKSARSAARHDGGRVLVFHEHVTDFADIDVGDAGEGPGDMYLSEAKLWSKDGKRVVGRDSVRCQNMVTTFMCDATGVVFGKGKITVSGVFFSEKDSKIAVTGGTGRFRGVGGDLTVIDEGDDSSVLVFHLTH